MSHLPCSGPQPEGVTMWLPRTAPLPAIQLTGACDWQAVAQWCCGRYEPREGAAEPRIVLLTGDGMTSAYAGDWIVRGMHRFMVWDAAEFGQAYDPAEPGEPA